MHFDRARPQLPVHADQGTGEVRTTIALDNAWLQYIHDAAIGGPQGMWLIHTLLPYELKKVLTIRELGIK
jgi:hypothetical protein